MCCTHYKCYTFYSYFGYSVILMGYTHANVKILLIIFSS